eukprot:TRINITY_DN2723_c0_g1_i1.p1 TRINITY_DN2723_c0_g1~~TRINITY_DN2723_c0_g1_i1.p1  ORF type:complete len:843 (-),score=210.29 TRINITY_DN2723_c0_g1_i1:47-2230(-)
MTETPVEAPVKAPVETPVETPATETPATETPVETPAETLAPAETTTEQHTTQSEAQIETIPEVRVQIEVQTEAQVETKENTETQTTQAETETTQKSKILITKITVSDNEPQSKHQTRAEYSPTPRSLDTKSPSPRSASPNSERERERPTTPLRDSRRTALPLAIGRYTESRDTQSVSPGSGMFSKPTNSPVVDPKRRVSVKRTETEIINRYNTPPIISILMSYTADHHEITPEHPVTAAASAAAAAANITLAEKEEVAEENPEGSGSNLSATMKRATTTKEEVTYDPGLNKDVHFLLPLGQDDIVIPVFGSEVSSMVAHALSSRQYATILRGLHENAESFEKDQTTVKPPADDGETELMPDKAPTEEGIAKAQNGWERGEIRKDAAMSSSTRTTTPVIGRQNTEKKSKDDPLTKISLQFRSTSEWESKMVFTCEVHYAYQFELLRKMCGIDELSYVRSLSRSINFDAKGGQSGSAFSKTRDDAFILKQIKKVEVEGFLEFATQYFSHINKVYHKQVPTALAKVFGVYTIVYKNQAPCYIVVMENLFCGRSIVKKFDLKGSLRSRHASGEVLLDENLLELMYERPILVDQAGKALLGMTVWNDSLFLSSLNVMDYSLIVGIDTNGKLVVGIIDYLRTYTWDKQLESWVKKTLLPTKGAAGQAHVSKIPTIISPKQYKRRFRYALWLYFLMIPHKQTLLSQLPDQEKDKDKNKKQGTEKTNESSWWGGD